MTQTAQDWNTQHCSTRSDAIDAWVGKLNEVYGSFSFEAFGPDDFHAAIRHRALPGFQIVDCECDPCGAGRTTQDIGKDHREVLGLQLVLSGREQISFGKDEVVLSPGDLMIWDTTRPMRFRVMERLHKVSVLMPLARLQSWLPQKWHSIQHKLDADSTAASLMTSYVRSVSSGFMSGAFNQTDALTEAAIGLLVAALEDPVQKERDSLRSVQLRSAQSYIENHLDDPDLSPTSIANGMRMSIRYVHWLFKATGITVFQYVVQQRLLRCRRDLENPRMQGRKIVDIAYSAGFQNATHFARRFRDEFGISPREFRASSLERSRGA